MRIPLAAGAWLDYDPEWLPSEEPDHALTASGASREACFSGTAASCSRA